ncbi:MAG: polysaccharide biosynthesis tyrosine autokinase [Cyanobium sp. M30B3]|nr:MAG: polysaccharide biosynthesis tyrosine autokinase [Cyanobium sp. M30B3]
MTSTLPPNNLPATANTATVAIAPPAYFSPQPMGETGDEGFSLQKFLRTVRRRQRTFIATLVLVSAASTAWLTYQRVVHPVYQGAFGLLVTDPVSPTTSGGQSNAPSAIGAVALNRASQNIPTLMRVLESPVVLNPVFTQLRSQWPGERMPTIRVEQYSASRGGQQVAAGILSIQVTGNNPAVITSALEQTRDTYLQWSLKQRRERLQEAVAFLNQQAPELEARASRIQRQVQDFRLRHRLLQPESEAAATRSQVDALRNQLIQQRAEITRLERLRSDVAAGRLVTSGFSSESSDTGSQTSVALTVPDQAQLAELEKLDSELADARSRYVPSNPLLVQLERARATLVPQIQATQLEALDAALNQFRNQTSSLQSQINDQEGRFDVQPALLREYADLEQKLRLAEGNVESYERSREQFQLEIAQNTVPWQVIAPPTVNPNPVEPKVGPGLLRALLLGLVAASGAALLREKMDHVFHSPTEVDEELGESLLGHIPYIEIFEGVRADRRFLLETLDGEDARITRYQKFQYQEAFRNLATSLRFLNSDQPIRSIALSSSIPSEGKSLVTVLLAKTLSELGQRVLLVDSDMRKPQIHHRLGVDNVSGLSNLLTDESLDWRALITPVANHTGWDLLTAGRQPPDPPRLLSSQRMAQLMQDITTNGGYDLVILDTPPALGLADAALVAEHIDGLLMLVSLRRVPRDLPKLAIRRIRDAGAPVLGVVTNSRQLRREGGDSPTYGYGGYGYGGYGTNKSYGYQSYANDPLLAYSYYDKSNKPRSDQAPKGWKAAIPTPGNLKRNVRNLGHKINNWLDE